MILRLAIRSLAIRPLRTAVLACGFGLGIAVMAVLLGIGEVILDQARSPALQGGGDLVISGTFGSVDSARFVMSSVLGGSDVRPRIKAASPSKKATLYLIKPGMALPVAVNGGVPSLGKGVGDPEIAGQSAWVDAPADEGWATPDPGDVLRAMDRFHPQPDVPEFASSWAEWLYFNGRTPDGRVRFYLTFLVGPSEHPGKRPAGVRLQLERGGQSTSYSSVGEIDEQTLLAHAPDLDIAGNHVRLEGLRYRITLRLSAQGGRKTGYPTGAGRGSEFALTGELTLDAAPHQSLPPAVIRGARGWLSGYVVPVLSGKVGGTLDVDGETTSLDGASGYHDHNWGYWQDVRWQWGQVAHDDLSFVYGRVFPPASVADPERMPGFLGVLGRDGPIGVSTNVSITERGGGGAPQEMLIHARGDGLDLRMEFSVDRSISTPRAMTRSVAGFSMNFLQLGGIYRVAGRAGNRPIDFTARGAAETFRQR
jgi:hypothetical protein